MISHDIDAAIQYASHIMHIDKNIFVGTKEEYLKTAMGQKSINLAGGDFNDWNN